MKSDIPIERDLVLVGGGHAHVAVIKGVAMHPIPGVRLTVISRDANTPYSGMLPGFLAGHYRYDECHVDLQRLCRFAGARFFHTEVTDIAPDARQIVCAGRPPVSYDLLSIDIGSTPSRFGIADAEHHAIAIKPVDEFLRRLADLETAVLTHDKEFRIIIIGGGAGGTELCLSLRHRLRTHIAARGGNPDRLHFSIVSNSASLLPNHAPGVYRRMQQAVADAGVTVHLMRRVASLDATGIMLSDNARLVCDAAILTTHAAAPAWLAHTGLALDARGFIQVRDTLASVSHDGVFAAGDIAAMQSRKLEKSGVYAVRQGPVLLKNLRLVGQGKAPVPYRPQARTLALISTGEKYAIASYGPVALAGEWVWRLKDRIDRRWMRKYQQLPETPGMVIAQASDPNAMQCGGCGAKVPEDILRQTLASLKQAAMPDIVTGLDAPDDAAVIAPPENRLLVQTVDQFRSFVDDPYLFGRITANHCLNDIYAMGAVPHSALAMVTLPFGPEQKLQQDMQQLMEGAVVTLGAAGVCLIGGHTAQGAEMMLGFTINGYAENADLLRKGGAQSGDVLILTKPLGTGALLAADMRARASAGWIKAATAMMLQSNGPAMDCLGVHGATACTDVSGFGLAGHLGEMLRASNLSASLDLDGLPVLPGAREVMTAGIFSSLHPANVRTGEALLQADDAARAHPNYALLFDPQTAGGLLACVPRTMAQACVSALHMLGYAQATAIGEIRPDMMGGRLIDLGVRR